MAGTEEMTEMTLIDAEDKILYKIILSPEDATRAKNDMQFAYALLQSAKKEDNKKERFLSESVHVNDPNPIASCSEDSTVEIRDQYIWSRSETLLLINLYKDHVEDFNNPKISTKQCWNVISKKMKDSGHEIPAVKCSTKFQCLKRTYKNVFDHNKKSGNTRKQWEYYEIMHEVFGTKPWMEPLATAGSSVNIGHSKTVDITNRENEDPKASKKRKVNDVVEDYFQKSIQLKEEKERNAQKRHEEKMAYLEKMESFMTKMFKK